MLCVRKIFSMGDRVSIYTMNRECVAQITQRLFHMLGMYEVEIQERGYHLKQQIHLFHSCILVEENG